MFRSQLKYHHLASALICTAMLPHALGCESASGNEDVNSNAEGENSAQDEAGEASSHDGSNADDASSLGGGDGESKDDSDSDSEGDGDSASASATPDEGSSDSGDEAGEASNSGSGSGEDSQTDATGDSDSTGDGDTSGESEDSSADSNDDGSEGSSDGGDEDDPITDIMPPSFDPPGGLSPNEVPQFVVFGFDDNRYTDGMKWVLDTFEGYENPMGSGNPETHDGQSARVSFYFTTDSLDANEPGLQEQWLRVAELRHEIANHTHTHRAMQDTVPWNWEDEINTSNARISELFGIDSSEILGVRAPFLDHNETLFEVISATEGMIYDCSVIHTPSGQEHDDWMFKRHIWPYTLEDGFYQYCAPYPYAPRPGIWQVPVYTMPRGASKPTRHQTDMVAYNMAGFDSTAYGTLKLSARDFTNSMKWALDFALEDGSNRAPVTIGVHSDTYSEKHKSYDDVATLAERRQAIVDFLDYAVSFPEVRIVTAKQLLQWMSNPVALE